MAWAQVVDAINVMVEEIETIVRDARQAVLQVDLSAGDLIVASDQMATGAEAQSRQASSASSASFELAHSVRRSPRAWTVGACCGHTLDALRRAMACVESNSRA